MKRVLVVAPKGLVPQWVQEMQTHFGEQFRLLIPSEFSAWRNLTGAENVWRQFDQVVCPADSIKSIAKEKGTLLNLDANFAVYGDCAVCEELLFAELQTRYHQLVFGQVSTGNSAAQCARHRGGRTTGRSKAVGPPARSTPLIFPQLWVSKMGDRHGSALNAWWGGLPRP